MTTKKGGHTIPMQPKQLTPEEIAKAQMRAIAQKVESTAQGVLFNLMNNPEAVKTYSTETMVAKSIEAAEMLVKGVGEKVNAMFKELFTTEEKKED